MAQHRVKITVDDDHLAVVEDVVAALRDAGLGVHQVNRRTGTIIGVVSTNQREGLSRVSGIASIEPVAEFRLAPPDADLQ
jgi:hypothetical protein